MVDALHAAGIEVILDVVPNHTCEGGVDGMTLSFRGLDAPAYYCCAAARRRHHRHRQHAGLRLADGGAAGVRRHAQLGRRRSASTASASTSPACSAGPARGPFDPHGPAAHGDHDRSRAVAVQADRRAVGRHRRGLPGGRVRRRSGRSGTAATATPSATSGAGHGAIGELASRLTGSEDLYGLSRRRPWASVNFVTAHDGFTLRDLVSYEHKHNEANGEDNRDGTDDNRSQNFGVEGETSLAGDPGPAAATARALLGTLLLSTGTPMLLGGDELWRTQGGNNNAYCLDDETSWVDWPDGVEAEWLTAFVARLAEIRRSSVDPAPRPLLPRRRRAPGGISRAARWTSDDWHDARHALAGPAGRGVADAAARRRRRAVHPPAGRPVHPADRQHPRRRHPGEHAARCRAAPRSRCRRALAPAAAPRRPARAVGRPSPRRPCTPAAPRAHPPRPCTRPTVHTSQPVHERRPGVHRRLVHTGAPSTAGTLRPCRATTSAAVSAPPPSRSTAHGRRW